MILRDFDSLKKMFFFLNAEKRKSFEKYFQKNENIWVDFQKIMC